MKVEPTSRDHIVRHIAKTFHSTGEIKATYLGVIAEQLRAGCLILGANESNGSSGLASSIRLCKQTYRRVTPLFSEYLGGADAIRDELDLLQDLGDLARIDGHYVSIAPARRLEIDADRSLLLGGGPIEVLPSVLQKQLVVSGRSRILNCAVPHDLQQAYPIQRLQDWLSLEDDDMQKWANDFVTAKINSKSEDLIPDALLLWDGRSWSRLDEYVGPAGTYLCRRNVNIFGNAAHDYGLIKFRRVSSTPKIDSHIPIEKEVARKLQGTLRPVRPTAEQFLFSRLRPGIIELTLRHPIAKQHSKLLHLGWKAKDSGALKPGVEKIEFSELLLPLLSKGFGLIGYELVSR